MARKQLGTASSNAADLITRGEVLNITPAATSFYAGGSVGIGAGALATVPLDSTEFVDRTGMVTLASNQMTIGVGGLYLLTARGNFTDSNTGARNLFFARNGNVIIEIGGYNAGSQIRVTGAAIVRLVASDVILMRAYASSAATLSGGSSAKDTGVTLARLGA